MNWSSKERDDILQDLAERPADHRSTRTHHRLGLNIWVAAPLGLLISILSFGGTGWYSAVHYYGVAEQAERFEDRLRDHTAKQAERIIATAADGRFYEALVAIDALIIGSSDVVLSESRIDVLLGLLAEVYDDYDLSAIERELRVIETRRLDALADSLE